MTYRELVYMCLDEIKLASDDSYITEDHILFLISKYRAFLLKQKYDKTNMPVSEGNYQTIELYLGDQIPQVLNIATPRITVILPDDTSHNCTYVSPHRFEFVSNNKFLSSVIYCTRDRGGILVFKPQFEDASQIFCEAVFADSIEASKVQVDLAGSDILDKECPIEAELVSGVQELVVKDALGIAYRPTDFINNAADDLNKIGMAAGNSKKQ